MFILPVINVLLHHFVKFYDIKYTLTVYQSNFKLWLLINVNTFFFILIHHVERGYKLLVIKPPELWTLLQSLNSIFFGTLVLWWTAIVALFYVLLCLLKIVFYLLSLTRLSVIKFEAKVHIVYFNMNFMLYLKFQNKMLLTANVCNVACTIDVFHFL